MEDVFAHTMKTDKNLSSAIYHDEISSKIMKFSIALLSDVSKRYKANKETLS